jgi:hypothetical protein
MQTTSQAVRIIGGEAFFVFSAISRYSYSNSLKMLLNGLVKRARIARRCGLRQPIFLRNGLDQKVRDKSDDSNTAIRRITVC